MSARRRTCRSGYSLLEMIVVIVIGSLLLGVTAMLLVAILGASAGNTRAVARQQMLLRLAQQWREDVNAQRKVAVGEFIEDEKLRRRVVQVGNVDYLAGEKEIHRTKSRFGTVLEREAFALAEGETATFAVNEEAGTATIRLQGDQEIEIVAAMGLSLRYREEAP